MQVQARRGRPKKKHHVIVSGKQAKKELKARKDLLADELRAFFS